MTESDRKAVRLRITGRVQGVSYRVWAVETATVLGLDGWVRNRVDGSVELLAVGESMDVDALIHACHAGPPAAAVTSVEVEPAEGIVARGFRHMPTV
ncbi:acylphosphatase [Govanella unica]|uniref:acylphosphatase n=1 Tax=Govanella unica TaxID=2975056 RepID=A0A9X3TWP4_9PROT|nr:acylphosphatase [Govania unica]MDA5193090.1 acylphosphatase [Govania unica]